MKNRLSALLCLVSSLAFSDQVNVELVNDCFFSDDSDLTHATRIEYVRDSGLRFAVGQNMYTPYDLRNADQVPGRHPYAGYLYGAVGYRDPVHYGSFTVYDDYELQVGVLGPSSGAEQTQKLIHKWLGCKYPAGWEHQLHDEFELQGVYWKGIDWRVFGHEYGWSVHLSGEVGGMLGILQIAPGVNAEIKVGYGFGDAESDHEMHVRAVARPVWSIYAIGGAEGRYWARNELLDGNAAYVHNHDTTTVDKEDWTGVLKAGVGARYRGVEARMLWIFPSREYKTQERTPNFGSLTLGFWF